MLYLRHVQQKLGQTKVSLLITAVLQECSVSVRLWGFGVSVFAMVNKRNPLEVIRGSGTVTLRRHLGN